MFFQKFRFYLLYSLILFLSVVPSAYAEDAIVSSVNPKNATAEKSTIFTVSGANLHKSIRLDIEECANPDTGGTKHYGTVVNNSKITYKCTPAFFKNDTGGNKVVKVRDTRNGKLLYEGVLKVSKKSIYYPKSPTVTAPKTAKIHAKTSISVKIGTDKDGDLVQVRCGIERSQYNDDYPYKDKAYQSSFKTGGSTITINDVVFSSLGSAIISCVSFDKSGKGSGVGSASIDITKTGKPNIDLDFSRDPEITLSPYEESTSIKWTVTGAKSYSFGVSPQHKYVTFKGDSNLLDKGTIKIAPKTDDIGTTIFTVTACDRFDKENCDSEKVTVNVIGSTVKKFKLSVSVKGQGTVTSFPSGINCTSNCSKSYKKGTIIKLTATPKDGYILDGWDGACAGLSCEIRNIDSDKSVTASFKTSDGVEKVIDALLLIDEEIFSNKKTFIRDVIERTRSIFNNQNLGYEIKFHIIDNFNGVNIESKASRIDINSVNVINAYSLLDIIIEDSGIESQRLNNQGDLVIYITSHAMASPKNLEEPAMIIAGAAYTPASITQLNKKNHVLISINNENNIEENSIRIIHEIGHIMGLNHGIKKEKEFKLLGLNGKLFQKNAYGTCEENKLAGLFWVKNKASIMYYPDRCGAYEKSTKWDANFSKGSIDLIKITAPILANKFEK